MSLSTLEHALETTVAACQCEFVGVDVVEIETWGRQLAVGGEKLNRRIYTEDEVIHCRGRSDRLATRLAAKEAVSKLLGTGLRGISPNEIEVVSEPSGRPTIELHGRARERASSIGVGSIELSLSHEAGYAFAVALGVKRRDDG